MAEVNTKFRVGLTRDILDSRGEPAFGRAALEVLDRDSNLQWEYLPAVVAEIGPELAAQYDALYINIARVPAAAVERADCRLRIVAACAAHGKTAAILAIDEAWAREYAAKGFRLMGYGVDQLLLQDALRNGLDVLRDAFDNAKADKGLPK